METPTRSFASFTELPSGGQTRARKSAGSLRHLSISTSPMSSDRPRFCNCKADIFDAAHCPAPPVFLLTPSLVSNTFFCLPSTIGKPCPCDTVSGTLRPSALGADSFNTSTASCPSTDATEPPPAPALVGTGTNAAAGLVATTAASATTDALESPLAPAIEGSCATTDAPKSPPAPAIVDTGNNAAEAVLVAAKTSWTTTDVPEPSAAEPGVKR